MKRDLRKVLTNTENPLPPFPEHISLTLLMSPLSSNFVEHLKYDFY